MLLKRFNVEASTGWIEAATEVNDLGWFIIEIRLPIKFLVNCNENVEVERQCCGLYWGRIGLIREFTNPSIKISASNKWKKWKWKWNLLNANDWMHYPIKNKS